MGRLRLLILTIALTAACTILLPINILYSAESSPRLTGKATGKKAPDFSIKDISGKTVSLSSFEGKPILLNIWATWCSYCRKERAHLNALYKEYADRGLIIIAVSTDRSAEKVRRYLKRIPADYMVLTDVDDVVRKSYGVYALPTNFLIDREGIIKYKFMGLRDWTNRDSKKIIEELLKE